MKSRFARHSVVFGALVSSLAMVAGGAAAQTKVSASNQLEEIVVTARKTSEKLQVTPVAVTALTPKALENRQVADVVDIGRQTPNLNIGSGNTGPATLVFVSLRGQAQNSPNSASDASVGVYIDGVYVGRPIVGNLGLLDMSGAEILRGPQGTLFGRNTTGGALNLTTNQPTNRFEGYAKVGIGNYDQRLVETVINVPLSNELSSRFAVRYDERSGFVNAPLIGNKAQDVNGDYYARGTLKWSPENLPLTVTLTGDYLHYRDHGNPEATFAINPGGLGGGAAAIFAAVPNINQYLYNGSNFNQTYGNPLTGNPEIDNPFNRSSQKSAGLTVDADFGQTHFKSITAYRESDTANNLDLDGTPALLGSFISQYKQRQFSQETQLSGSLGKLDWITGLYYFVEKGSERSDSAIFSNFVKLRALSDFRAQSVGAFVQGNYHFTERLRGTAGFRYTWDTRSLNRHGISDWSAADPICAVGPNAGLKASVARCDNPVNHSYKYPAWLASLDYEVNDDVFVYLKTSGASMAGGINTRQVPPALESFNPEHEKDVEFGIKADLLDKRLRTNAAAFYTWGTGVQRIVNTVYNGNLTQYVTNAGNTRTYGVEFEFTALPWDGMEVTGQAAYLKAKYAKSSYFDVQNISGVNYTVDRSGEPVPYAPKWTWGLGATQRFPMTWGSIVAHADWSYTASRVAYVDTPAAAQPAAIKALYAIQNEQGIIRGYGLLNARLAFNIDSPDLEIAFWGKNITQKKYFTNIFDSLIGFGVSTQSQGAPRTYGATVTYHW